MVQTSSHFTDTNPGVSFVHDGKVIRLVNCSTLQELSLTEVQLDLSLILKTYSIFMLIDRMHATILLKSLEMSDDEILDYFYSSKTYNMLQDGVEQTLEWDRLKGTICPIDILDLKGQVLVPKGRRLNARHEKICKEAGITSIKLPLDEMLGKIISKAIFDQSTGEILIDSNVVIDQNILEKILEYGLKDVSVLDVDQLNNGSYIADTLRADSTQSTHEALIEIYRVMRPGEPPTGEAAKNLFNSLFFDPDRYDVSAVGRMKINKRLRRDSDEGPRTLSKEDILDIIKQLVLVRDGHEEVDDIDNLGNRRIRCVGEMVENQFRVGLLS